MTTPQVDKRLLLALGHPARQRVITLLNERVATVSQISRELGIPETEVRSHLDVLLENEAIEATDGMSYRATIRPFLDDAHWAQLPVHVRRALFAQNIRQIVEHLTSALAEDGFDERRTHVSLTRIDLDRRGWDAVADLLAEVLERAMDIHAESVDRVARGESQGTTPADETRGIGSSNGRVLEVRALRHPVGISAAAGAPGRRTARRRRRSRSRSGGRARATA